jgi:hypothetical protein
MDWCKAPYSQFDETTVTMLLSPQAYKRSLRNNLRKETFNPQSTIGSSNQSLSSS